MSDKDKEIAMLWSRATRLQDALEDMVWQFGHRSVNAKGKFICSGGLSTLEYAFGILGWEDIHYVEEGGCQYEGCLDWDTCGIPVKGGYKRVCGKHYQELDKTQGRD